MQQQTWMSLVVLVWITNSCIIQSAEWDYEGPHGPSHWADDYPICGGSSQSPIDIKAADVTVDTSYTAITYTGYGTAPSTLTLRHTGHSIQVDVEGDVQISGGKLPGTYKLAQFHLHWGDVDTTGSEHLLDGTAYPIELHLVHYNTLYDSLGDALDQEQGLAVIGVFFQIGNESEVFDRIESNLDSIPNEGDSFELTPFALEDLVPTGKYYRYNGSLTTPGCQETIDWTVYDSILTISQQQMETLRTSIYEGVNETLHQLTNNYRPPQPLNERMVITGVQPTVRGGDKGNPNRANQLHNQFFLTITALVTATLHLTN